MNQLTEETANKLADAFKQLNEEAIKTSSILDDHIKSMFKVYINSVVDDYCKRIMSYHMFDIKYPLNRVKMIFMPKRSNLKMDSLVVECNELIDKLNHK